MNLVTIYRLIRKAQLMSRTIRGAAMREVADGVWSLRTYIVNVVFVSETEDSWVLIDAGMYGSANRIKAAAAELFGEDSRPSAIHLTHGHFDHVGALEELAKEWDVPVYAHSLELPYLTGKSKYPPPDPSVGGGAMSTLSFAYPRGPIDVSSRVQAFPQSGLLPGMPGWQLIHTPGHTPGHVSFFRPEDRCLIAGDAFVTTKQESLTAVLLQRSELNGPPMYYTSDWQAAGDSVRRLAALRPETAITGHGLSMEGEELAADLNWLASNFESEAVPEHGRYVDTPALSDEGGTVAIPPGSAVDSRGAIAMLAAALALGAGFYFMRRRS